MAEYVEREALLKHKTLIPGFVGEYVHADRIREAPAADVVEVLHGEWLICADGYYPYCSRCGKEPKNGELTNYCPDCGARMDGE